MSCVFASGWGVLSVSSAESSIRERTLVGNLLAADSEDYGNSALREAVKKVGKIRA